MIFCIMKVWQKYFRNPDDIKIHKSTTSLSFKLPKINDDAYNATFQAARNDSIIDKIPEQKNLRLTESDNRKTMGEDKIMEGIVAGIGTQSHSFASTPSNYSGSKKQDSTGGEQYNIDFRRNK